MQTPTNFTVSPISQQGDVYGTLFTFKTSLPSQYKAFAWSFGDGNTSYNNSTVTHTYNYPGIYSVGLSAWSDAGLIITDNADINVDYAYRDNIAFTRVPSTYGTPSLPSSEPFIVSLTSAKIDQPLSIVLQALNTKSVPHYAVPDKWNFITPTWRFVDAETNEILDGPILLSSTPIYKNSKIVATKATASFYYIDDLSTGLDPNNSCPLLITATLSSERFTYPPESLIYPYASYSNSEVTRALIAWQINDVIPTKLKITENFLNDVYPIKWAGIPIPVMITCEFDSSLIESFEGTDNNTSLVLSYPRTNEIGEAFPLTLSLSANNTSLIPGVHYTIEEPSLHFKATDEYNNIASGYIFTTITPLSPIDSTIVVAASTVTINQFEETNGFSFPVGYPIYSEVYVSHPSKSTINRIRISTYPPTCENINYYKNLGVLVEGVASFLTVPTLTSTDLVNYSLTGTAAVYGMAFNPVKNKLYTCDADQNFLTSYSSGTTLLTSIQLSSIVKNEVLAPSYISIDQYSNIWVSLFDDQKLLKFDSNLNFLLSAIPFNGNYLATQEDDEVPIEDQQDNEPLLTEEDGTCESYVDFLTLQEDVTIPIIEQTSGGVIFAVDEDTYSAPEFQGFGKELDQCLLFPPIVETDKDSNVWACYAYPSNSILVKFNSDGTELFKATDLPKNSMPVSLAINATNDVWVACKQTNCIMQFTSEGTLVNTIEGFTSPSYIAMDQSNNVWIAHSYDLCSVYNTTTETISTWKISTNPQQITKIPNEEIECYLALQENENESIIISSTEDPEYENRLLFNCDKLSLEEDEIWGGLATDVYNRVWIIDSVNNTVITFNPENPTNFRMFAVIPPADTNYVLISNNNFVSNIPANNVRSAQAGGDWTGNRWYQKYSGSYKSMQINGTSAPFRVYDIDKSFQITKVNEEFDCSAYFKSLALPEILNQNAKLFDEFFAAVVGDGNPTKESAGRVIYERIANFVSNRGDFETAEIDALLSIAREMSVGTYTFGKDFPVAVNRLLNIFSIPKQQLRGVPNLVTDIEDNIGSILSNTSLITANKYYFAKDKQYGTQQLVYANPSIGDNLVLQEDGITPIVDQENNIPLLVESDNDLVYPLDRLEVEGFREPIVDNYHFFEYDDQNSNGYLGNVINWDSDYTTVSYSLSTNEEWYGDGGLVETMFNNLLTKQMYLQ